jgi:hypothetical protein
MRQAIRVYAIVALVAMLIFLVGLWTSPNGYEGGQFWLSMALFWVYGLQLWVLLIVPLGVLAASDAARAWRTGWLALFIALLIIAPFAAWIGTLVNNVGNLFAGPCLPNANCSSGSIEAPLWVIQAGWIVAFLPIPIATLVYSLTATRSAARPAATGVNQSEWRTLVVWAITGMVLMSALGYLGTSNFLFSQLAHRSFEDAEIALNLQNLLFTLWFTLAALPVAIASAAMAHAARTGSRGWLASWIALITLALLTADLGSLFGWSAIAAVTGAHSSDQMPYLQTLRVISVVAPVVIMLVALVYANAVQRPRAHAAEVATA